MDILNLATTVLVFIAFMAFAGKRMLTYMHILQQEEYNNGRLWGWIKSNRTFDKRLSLVMIILGAIWFFIPAFFIQFLIFIAFVFTAYIEKDPRKDSKKKLVSTARARRIFIPAYILSSVLALWCFGLSEPWIWIVNIQALPFCLMLSNMLIQPFEDVVQKKYWNEAREKIQRLSPTIIGITGSYGKTSVKHMLGHILKSQAPTLVTPGSVNTPMGITRIIREELQENHKYFVVEMGAYGPGSIERLCALTPPDFGIITAIGHAHYERFKSLETVSEAKFELAEAVFKKSGKTIIHERTLRFPHPRAIKENHEDDIIVVGEPPVADNSKQKDPFYISQDDLKIQRIQQLPTGLEIRLSWKGTTYIFEVPLYGLHHGHNAALAFAAARTMGIDTQDIVDSFRSLPQIEHRLEVKKQGDLTVIDDAYNSNPLGFRSALDLLSIVGNKGRKILITPGMVELGAAHNEAHEKIGNYAGQVCDMAIAVSPKRIPTFIKGFKATSNGKTLVEVATFDEAQKWLMKNKQPGDVVLIENDLPDMYERIPKM